MKRALTLTTLLLAGLLAAAQPMAYLERTVSAIRQEQGMQHGVFSVCVYNVSK